MRQETKEPKYPEQVEMYRNYYLQPVTGRYMSQLVGRVVIPTWGILQEQADDSQYAEGDAA